MEVPRELHLGLELGQLPTTSLRREWTCALCCSPSALRKWRETSNIRRRRDARVFNPIWRTGKVSALHLLELFGEKKDDVHLGAQG